MRVLVYTSLFPNQLQPNSGIFVKQRMFHFAALAEHAIQVVAPVPYCPSWFPLKPWRLYAKIGRNEDQEGIPVFHPRYSLIPKASMLFHGLSLFACSLKTIQTIQRSFPFDLIDSHYIYPDGFAAVLLGRFFQKPIVLSARGSDINQFTRFASIRPMIRYALRNSDGIISVCTALKSEMVGLGIQADKISVIPNGVDLERFDILNKIQCRRSLGLPEEAAVILSIGNLIARKGFGVLLQATAAIASKVPDILLCIIGEGPLRKELASTVEKLRIQKHVRFLGEKPNAELIRWYNAADVFCLASSREGWANVIMEALACGCPVVATNVYGAAEILTSSAVGHLVEPSPTAFAHAVNHVLARSYDRQLIREHVASRSWSTVAREVEAIFSKCHNGP